MAEPVILELAVNGATPRHRNRHVPRTPAEITDTALAGIESGASIVHNHNDEPMFTAEGVHAVEPYLAAWRPVLERYPDALLYPTMAAGARGIPVARRWAHAEELARRGMGGMTLVDPGSVNLGLTSAGAVAADAAAGPYANSLADVEYPLRLDHPGRSTFLHAFPADPQVSSIAPTGFLSGLRGWRYAVALPGLRRVVAVLRPAGHLNMPQGLWLVLADFEELGQHFRLALQAGDPAVRVVQDDELPSGADVTSTCLDYLAEHYHLP